MRRFFIVIMIGAFASAGASASHAQSRRVRRAEPPKEVRAEKPETAEDAQGEAKDEAKEKPQDGAQADHDKLLTDKEVAVRVVIKSKPAPIYPYEARSRGVQGAVKLRIILGADGKVGDKIEVLEGLPYGITEAAIKVARQIKFEPARLKDGRPVSRRVIIFYHFNLY